MAVARRWRFLSFGLAIAAAGAASLLARPLFGEPRPAPASIPAPALAQVVPSGVAKVAAPSPTGFYESTLRTRPSVAAMTELGRVVFADRSLSASGRVACASCHHPAHAGHAWDGRAASIHEQAKLPLLSAEEMGNHDAEAVVAKIERAPYAGAFRALFGADVFADRTRAFDALLLVLEVFQQSPADFYPYSSKYDASLRRQVELSAAERRGLALFNDPAKGNCALCHPSTIREGALPSFSDWGYVALGVPRNPTIAANRDPRWFDLGLCGPLRRDLAERPETCGLFRTPSLRNVARRRAFFHNGVLHRLEDVVAFYGERDTRPERWYPRTSAGKVAKFDDLPERYRGNVNGEAPFGGAPGAAPSLAKRDIADIVAFLKTLDDGWQARRALAQRAAR